MTVGVSPGVEDSAVLESRRRVRGSRRVRAVRAGVGRRGRRGADRAVWDDPRCVRYGVADRQRGAAEIAAWRRAHPSVPPGRRLRDTVIVAVDERTAVVSTGFGYPDAAAEGRPTQTWARLEAGWRIIAARVSEIPAG